MSQIPNMLESTIQKIREMVDVNSVIGEPISTPDGVTIIPAAQVLGGAGGGSGEEAEAKQDRRRAAHDPTHQLAFVSPA